MKTYKQYALCLWRALIVTSVGAGVLNSLKGLAETALTLEHDPLTGGLLLEWDVDEALSDGLYQIEWSDDLEVWKPLHRFEFQRRLKEQSPAFHLIQEPSPIGFYRLVERESGAVVAMVSSAKDGADLYGFTEQLETNLASLGEISVDEFVERYDRPQQFVESLSYDPASAEFLEPVEAQLGRKKWDSNWLSVFPPFEFSDTERQLLAENGFVVSGRLGHHSFIEGYYEIFVRDLPVFVSLDSILHPWTKAYRSILLQTEANFLSPAINEMILAMRDQLPVIAAEVNADLEDSLHDVDLYLAVAATLGHGRRIVTKLGRGNEERAALVKWIESREVYRGALFGRENLESIDFSEFEPRSHYTSSRTLRRYFQMMTWLGRIDFRVAGSSGFASPREMGAAVILSEALNRSGHLDNWAIADRILRTFVGLPDSMTVPQLNAIMEGGGLSGAGSLPSIEALKELQERIEASTLGVQGIHSHGYLSSPFEESIKLPRSFTLFGQRFGMDSWALGNLVFDKIFWEDERVVRRVPSSVDVAFTLFDNAAATPILASRIRNRDGVPFRDGYPYQHHLGALRDVFAELDVVDWKDNIYTSWLHTLRQWSQPLDPSIPEVFRTREWGKKTMSSQLASWTYLRHNTVLHTKKPATLGDITCSFPHSYLEPNVEAWEGITAMARRLAKDLSQLERPGLDNSWDVRYLERFGATCDRLTDLVRKQNRREAFSQSESRYLQDMVERMVDYYGNRTYSGWYPGLYYRTKSEIDALRLDVPERRIHPSDEWDPVVTDVHTDHESTRYGDPGTILHQAVGNTAMLFVSVQCQENRMYAGPVSTYYEFTSGPGVFERMTNEEWKKQLRAGEQPEEPEWTRGHRVPGTADIPAYL